MSNKEIEHPLILDLDAFLNKILFLKSTLFEIRTTLQNNLSKTNKAINKRKPKIDLKHISNLVISDLTDDDEGDWELNYPTKYQRVISWSKYGEEVNRLLSQEAGYAVAQACEAFNSYLKNIAAHQLMNNKDIAIALDSMFSNCFTLDEFKSCIRNSNKTRKPHQLFNVIKNTCSEFEKSNDHNNLNIPFNEFYQMVAFVRHKITHTSGQFKHTELLAKETSVKKLINKHVTIEHSKDLAVIKMTTMESQLIMKRLAEISFTIFKSISISNNYDWSMILKQKKD